MKDQKWDFFEDFEKEVGKASENRDIGGEKLWYEKRHAIAARMTIRDDAPLTREVLVNQSRRRGVEFKQ